MKKYCVFYLIRLNIMSSLNFLRVQKIIFYISLNLGPVAGPVQAITIALQLPIIETRVTILLGLARADARDGKPFFPSVDAAVRRTAELRRGAWGRLRRPSRKNNHKTP